MLALLFVTSAALLPQPPPHTCHTRHGRRAVLSVAAAVAAAAPIANANAAAPMALEKIPTASSGLQWTDLRAGEGAPAKAGQTVVIDYMMTRRGGAKIHSTVQAKQPFSWVLGDGSVIAGLEEAVLGSADVPPLLPGGARRLVVPQALGYGAKIGRVLAADGILAGGAGGKIWNTEVRENVGPVPPEYFQWYDERGDVVSSYQRFKDIYLNENRMEVPDLVLDVKLVSVGGQPQVTLPTAAAAPEPMVAAPVAPPAAPAAAPPAAAPVFVPAAPALSETDAELARLREELAKLRQGL